jgi:hypothetical protein
MQALEASPMVAEHQGKSRDQRTGADLIAALQASPYRELVMCLQQGFTMISFL